MENQNVHRLNVRDKEVILVGTAHVSRESAELVERVIEEERPDTVCIELCQARYDAITQKNKWQEMDIVKVLKDKRASLLLAQLLMASFQRKIAQKFNINPGEEMLRAIAKAEETGARVELADREIRVTLMRTWRMMGFWTKIKFLSEVIMSLFVSDEITEEDIEKLKEHDVLDLALKTVGEKLPSLKHTLIDERDMYLAHSIREAEGGKIVAVVGAGHVPGIIDNIDRDIDIASISTVPPQGLIGRFMGWGFSLAIIALFIGGFFHAGSKASLDMVLSWSIITATCAAIGAIVLLAHPFTIIASALSAPIATLHPLIATGWVAGLTEATMRKPQVKDFLDLKDDIGTLKGFFHNKITRILLRVAFVNLTTSVGTFVALGKLLTLF
ncbi:MAG: TraB/GumN family protein [Smithellaceae bacterium]|nr:TraB/GumN family protein [Smithellaceae bacterium]